MAMTLQTRSVAAASRASVRVQAPRAFRTVLPVQRRNIITRAADTEAVLVRVQSIIAEQLGKEKSEVTAEAKFVDLGADSLDTVEIMMALEEEFGITLDEEGSEKIATVEDAAKLIADQVNKA